MQLQQVFSILSETQHDLAVKRNCAPLKEWAGVSKEKTVELVALNSIPRVLH